jgi:hypothetical protein
MHPLPEHGFGKPEERAYNHAMEVLIVGPNETWMVGDNLEWEIVAPARPHHPPPVGITAVAELLWCASGVVASLWFIAGTSASAQTGPGHHPICRVA